MGRQHEDMLNFLVTEDKTILETMELLGQSAKKILFIHNNGKLLATVTDGDIRRWILKGGDLNKSIRLAANYQPVYLDESDSELADKVMKRKGIEAIPLVNKEKKIQKIIFLNPLEVQVNQFDEKVPVVIMAGGLGNRLSPYTNVLPKPLIPIGELPIVEHVINQFRKYGCDDFRMIVNYKKNMIKAYFNESKRDYAITYISENKPLGTGGGLGLLKGTIGNTFILTNCDILIDTDLCEILQYHKKSKNLITMICSLKNFTIPYGVVNVGCDGNIESMQEKPSMTFHTNTGCYFLEPEVIEEMSYNESIDFPDVVNRYIEENKKVGVYSIDENAWLDMGQMDELEKMKKRLGVI